MTFIWQWSYNIVSRCCSDMNYYTKRFGFNKIPNAVCILWVILHDIPKTVKSRWYKILRTYNIDRQTVIENSELHPSSHFTGFHLWACIYDHMILSCLRFPPNPSKRSLNWSLKCLGSPVYPSRVNGNNTSSIDTDVLHVPMKQQQLVEHLSWNVISNMTNLPSSSLMWLWKQWKYDMNTLRI